jgi:hypothetical protein
MVSTLRYPITVRGWLLFSTGAAAMVGWQSGLPQTRVGLRNLFCVFLKGRVICLKLLLVLQEKVTGVHDPNEELPRVLKGLIEAAAQAIGAKVGGLARL